jgi:hypothetical protein
MLPHTVLIAELGHLCTTLEVPVHRDQNRFAFRDAFQPDRATLPDVLYEPFSDLASAAMDVIDTCVDLSFGFLTASPFDPETL